MSDATIDILPPTFEVRLISAEDGEPVAAIFHERVSVVKAHGCTKLKAGAAEKVRFDMGDFAGTLKVTAKDTLKILKVIDGGRMVIGTLETGETRSQAEWVLMDARNLRDIPTQAK
ncbi:MAG: hypothetical protein U0984_07580 [Prosthecobacter sp.]|nr:hypothetical protein [Prosthecobacter sp.]